jgi:beta-lactamase superfamily II metal-dependent hydrolase
MRFRQALFFIALLGVSRYMSGQAADGKLQIDHIVGGHGHASQLTSPTVETAVVDVGEDLRRNDCRSTFAYIDQLEVRKIDYLFSSHYHYHHFGCILAVLQRYPLANDAYNRGRQSYTTPTYVAHATALRGHLITAQLGASIVPDEGSVAPVRNSVVAVDRLPSAWSKTSMSYRERDCPKCRKSFLRSLWQVM